MRRRKDRKNDSGGSIKSDDLLNPLNPLSPLSPLYEDYGSGGGFNSSDCGSSSDFGGSDSGGCGGDF